MGVVFVCETGRGGGFDEKKKKYRNRDIDFMEMWGVSGGKAKCKRT